GIPRRSSWGMDLPSRRLHYSLLVDCLRIENALVRDGDLVLVEPPKKTALIAFVASSPADLMHLEEDCISIAIEKDLADFLDVSRFLAFAPQALAAAAEIDRSARAHGFAESFLIHPRQH